MQGRNTGLKRRTAGTSSPEDTPCWSPESVKSLKLAHFLPLFCFFSCAAVGAHMSYVCAEPAVCPLLEDDNAESKKVNHRNKKEADYFWSLPASQALSVGGVLTLLLLYLNCTMALMSVQKFYLFFCPSDGGLCMGKRPAKMLSWKLRILTSTTLRSTLLLLGCSHRRERQAYAG
ncbi:hypothetical protein CHARACLAT_001182 [Characodon lateralis]|uniref:Uncharacterized protein n=1 Tax=Characodon lateralis TaxID=208331 RepID=A0ABU7DWN8_9TELE|nr:hypothetical protein [Characodon lateralis]